MLCFPIPNYSINSVGISGKADCLATKYLYFPCQRAESIAANEHKKEKQTLLSVGKSYEYGGNRIIALNYHLFWGAGEGSKF